MVEVAPAKVEELQKTLQALKDRRRRILDVVPSVLKRQGRTNEYIATDFLVFSIEK